MIHPIQTMKENARKISNLFSRGVVTRTTSTTKTQKLQMSMMADESRDDIEHPQEYGHASVPLEGAETIAGFYGGNKDHGSVLRVFDKRYHPRDLEPGESCIYNHEGTRVNLRNGGIVEIIAGTEVTITVPKLTISGDLEVHGNITDNKGSNTRTVKGMRDVYNVHTHGGGVPQPTGAEDM